jgi:excisionase family DNA binding protein
MIDTDDDVLTLKEAARLLHLTKPVVLQMATSGRLPGRCIDGKEWRFSRRALLEWVAGRDLIAMPQVHLTPRPEGVVRRPTHPKLIAEWEAFNRLLPELLRHHPGRYVAVHDGAVVAVEDTEVGALTAAHTARPGVLVLVRRVTDGTDPLERIPSFRPVEAE